MSTKTQNEENTNHTSVASNPRLALVLALCPLPNRRPTVSSSLLAYRPAVHPTITASCQHTIANLWLTYHRRQPHRLVDSMSWPARLHLVLTTAPTRMQDTTTPQD